MTGILLPLYIYPTDPAWSEVARAQKAYPSIRIVAVINPASGPGLSPNIDYGYGIKRLQKAGITVAGYIATTYGKKSIADVNAEKVRYVEWYGLDAWFYDEVLADAVHRDYYESLEETSASDSFSIGNAGTLIPIDYIGLMDNFVVYENQGLPNLSTPVNFDSKNFSFIAYGLSAFPTLQTWLTNEFGYIFLTSGVLPNPYTTTGYLWETLAALFARSKA